jgi:hypothetical protein
MIGRFSRLKTFLAQFERSKAATGKTQCSTHLIKQPTKFGLPTDEIRTAASRMHDYLVGSDVEHEMFHGADKITLEAIPAAARMSTISVKTTARSKIC